MQMENTMIKVCGYAAQQAKAPLTPYSFERRNLQDNDVLIEIQVLWYMSFGHPSSQR